MYSSTLSLTSALYAGGWATSRPSHLSEAGWVPQPVSTGAENLALIGIRSPNRKDRSKPLYRLRYSRPPPNKYIYKPTYVSSSFSHCCYIPGWHFTSSPSVRHSSLNSALILQFLHSPLAKSSSNPSQHPNFCLPLVSRLPPGLVQRTFFAGSLSCILITCPAYLSASSLINFTTSYSSYTLHISEFLRLLQNPCSIIGPNIFRRTFL